jgi:capsular exopolysaccharide synthesis family protein
MSKLLNAPENQPGGGLPAIPASYTAPPYGQEMEPEEPHVSLSHYLWILRRHCWKIIAFVVVCVIATAVVSVRLTPIYESTATVDIDRHTPTGILGHDAEANYSDDADQFIATQVKLIQSDSVLRPVVQKYKLNVVPQPVATNQAKRPQREDAPVGLGGLKVTRPPNTYLLLISYRSPDPDLAAGVANAVANSYIEHTFDIRFRSTAALSTFMERQLEELKAKMESSSMALAQFEKELNVINPEEKTNILSARLLQLNTEYTTAQGDRVRKEAAYNSVRSGSLEAVEVSTQADALKKLAERLNEAQEKMAQVATEYGKKHPEYAKAASQLSSIQAQFESARQNIARRVEVEYKEAQNRELMLKQAVTETKAEFDHINARSFEYQAVKRGAEADKKLYEELTTKIKEATINAGFQNNAIRLADSARPGQSPVYPNIPYNLALAFLGSSLLAIAAAVVGDSMDSTIRDPEQVRRMLSTEVVGSLPLIKAWRKKPALALAAPAKVSEETALTPAKQSRAQHHVTSFEESVRTLLNSIELGNLDRKLKSLMVTSASPSEGKSTVAVHLAIAHAQQKLKTLLIDCDLRRPSIHRLLNLPNQSGLSTALLNGLDWKAGILKVPEVAGLDILPAGPVSSSAVGLAGRGLAQILAQAAEGYDLIIVDSPPVLGFPEPLRMAAAVDGVVMVSLAGRTSRKAVGSALNILSRVRANVIGIVLNQITGSESDGYYYYGYGGYGKYHHYYTAEGRS